MISKGNILFCFYSWLFYRLRLQFASVIFDNNAMREKHISRGALTDDDGDRVMINLINFLINAPKGILLLLLLIEALQTKGEGENIEGPAFKKTEKTRRKSIGGYNGKILTSGSGCN